MRAVLAILFVGTAAGAAEVRVSLHEKATGAKSAYAFDTERGSMGPIRGADGVALPAVETLRIVSGRLCATACLLDADEILFQGRLDNGTVAVVRDEYNSFANPLRWLAALSGHPVQVSSILVLQVEDGRIRAKAELTRKAASYHWEARVVR
jgi:hypothetical protein